MEIYRGDIFYIKKGGYNTGSEQEAGRPGVIVSNNMNNSHSSTVEVVYLTTQEKTPLPTHAEVICKVPSTALCEQIWSVSVDRLGDWIKECTEEEMAAIDKALSVSLDLSTNDTSEADKLREELERAEKLISTKTKYINALEQDLEALKNQPKTDNSEVVILETQRDMYKQQYEALLERLIAR